MTQVITITIPHQLSRAEAKRRLQEAFRSQTQFGPLVGAVKQTWNGDTLEFAASVGGQEVTGKAFIEDHQVRVEIALPWFMAALAGAVRQGIEQHTSRALGHDPAQPK